MAVWHDYTREVRMLLLTFIVRVTITELLQWDYCSSTCTKRITNDFLSITSYPVSVEGSGMIRLPCKPLSVNSTTTVLHAFSLSSGAEEPLGEWVAAPPSAVLTHHLIHLCYIKACRSQLKNMTYKSFESPINGYLLTWRIN